MTTKILDLNKENITKIVNDSDIPWEWAVKSFGLSHQVVFLGQNAVSRCSKVMQTIDFDLEDEVFDFEGRCKVCESIANKVAT